MVLGRTFGGLVVWKAKVAVDALFALTLAVFGVGMVEFLTNKNFASGCIAIASAVALLVNGYDQIRSGRVNSLEKQVKGLIEQNEQQGRTIEEYRKASEASQSLAQGNRRQLEDMLRHLKHQDEERIKDQFELAQHASEILRIRGVLAGNPESRQRLRAAMADMGSNVLVVEDDPGVRRAMARVIQHHGLRVSQADSIAEAISLLRARELDGPRYDFILLDLSLPDGSGIEVIDEVKRLGVPTNVIVCTGQLDDAVLERAAAGSLAVLIKPVDRDTLLGHMGVQADPPPPAADNP